MDRTVSRAIHNARYTGQRYNTRTAHRSGQPYGGLGPWLLYQERKTSTKKSGNVVKS